ncbi:unnamed protein product [Cuscuta epithymum]|uniref:PPM-type phosphatase domain-containing protein n=1 Tax=Cuscuta epithymum TaxID=186058 RepID=A0AAV0CI34_9ASTE|nr:unnamed protein product [Cuscuta epithymum]CAH9128515.1 unnamed protein product [Cuscuta epithymum]
MEGLIPFVYRSIKRSITRRRYECLSSGTAAAGTFNVSPHFYPSTFNVGDDHFIVAATDGRRRHGGRRQMSHQVDYSGGFSPERSAGVASSKSKQLGKFKSHRMFCCVTGL